MTVADRLRVTGEWLDHLPVDLPEPTHVQIDRDPRRPRNGTPEVRWSFGGGWHTGPPTDPAVVARILDALGGEGWLPCEWSRHRVHRIVNHLGTDIRVEVIYNDGDLWRLLSDPATVAGVGA